MLENRILVVDDDPSWQELLRECIETVPATGSTLRLAHSLTVAGSYAEADALLDRRHFHLAFLDLRLREDARDLDGKRLAAKISELDEGTSVVIATGHADVSTAITALKEWKVLDFVLKDAWDPGKVAQLVQTGIPLARGHYRVRYESAVEFLRGEQAVFPWIAAILRAVAPDAALPRADRRLADFLNELLDELYPLLHDRAEPEVAIDAAAGTARVRGWSKALGLPVSLHFGQRAAIEAEARALGHGFSRAERIVDDEGLGLRGAVYVPDAPPVDAFVRAGAGGGGAMTAHARASHARILVTGAGGQIGTELVTALRGQHGDTNVIATDLRPLPDHIRETGPTERLDVTQADELAELMQRCRIDTIYHLAAILSATGEEKPRLAWHVNIGGLYNVLEVARELGVRRIYHPSSIAAFGPETPKAHTPQETVLRPTTMYGITKVTGEMLGAYYHHRYGLDVRGIRYPGVISSETLPGGGTTDYAVEIFYEAIRQRRYTCFVRADTVLPMIYMPDCIRATLMLMEADAAKLVHAAEYNLASLSFSAGELAAEIARRIPGFTCDYRPDFRQQIADSWPQTIDDSAARAEWGWQPEYDLAGMVADMLAKLTPRLTQG